MMDDIDIREHLFRAYRTELWRRRAFWPILKEYLDRDQYQDAQDFFHKGPPPSALPEDTPFIPGDAEAGRLPSLGWYDDISRQRGKSFKWCTIAVAWAHCHPGQYIKYAAQLGVSVRGIIVPTINKLVADMPEDMRPAEDKIDHVWRFPKPDGKEVSEIKAAGVNLGHHDDLRGPKSHVVIEDEAAFYDDFDKVQQVLGPQLQTTNGVKVFATTPPYTTSHPIKAVRDGLRKVGRYAHRTIYEHPRMTAEEIERHLVAMATERALTLQQFKETTYYRREYLCMHVVENSRAVVPEWSGVASAEHPEGTTWGAAYRVDMPRPVYVDTYEGMDLGFTKDPSAWIGGYWDFSAARLVIEYESPPMFRKRAEELAQAVIAYRRLAWPTTSPPPYPEARKSQDGTYWLPYLAVGDAGGRGAERLDELAKESADLYFLHAQKADLETMVNGLRQLVAQGKLFIHPRCTHLWTQLDSGLWADTSKTDFERSLMTGEHLDHLAALVYLVRHVDRQRNPIPQGYGLDPHNTINMLPTPEERASVELDKALGGLEWE